ncbi:MAG: flagellin [Faecalimonas sp.]|nr:flagellin [Faecalimonas sp.]
MRIQHNIAALNSYRNLTGNNNAVSKNLEKLSSGYKINRAGDDAAGLAISEKMRAQITGLNTAQKNAQDGVSLVQTAEGALTEVHSMLNRMVELADQSANGTYDNAVDRANLQKEITSLKSEIDRIADSTNFNGIDLLNGDLSTSTTSTLTATATTDKAGVDLKFTFAEQFKGNTINVKVQKTAQPGEQISVSVAANGEITIKADAKKEYTADEIKEALANATLNGITGDDQTKMEELLKSVTVTGEGLKGFAAADDFAGTTVTGTTTDPKGEALTLQIGDTSADFNQMNVSVGDMHTDALGIKDIDISNQAGAKAAVDKIKAAINSVSSTRGDLGAIQNRLEHTINNLSVTAENMTAAESRIRDVDMANEMMAYTKNNILVQSSQAMLAQANQIPQGVLQLLQ